MFASLIFFLLVLITAKDQICEHRPKCVFSYMKIIKNGLRGVRNGVRRCLVCVFLGKTQGFSNLWKKALGLVRALIFTFCPIGAHTINGLLVDFLQTDGLQCQAALSDAV